jgi:Domain of unknown function (DUF4386)
MKGQTFQRFASAAAFIVALSSLVYGLVYLFLVPADLKGLPPKSLVAFDANPTGRQIASLMLALGGLAASAAIVAVYQRVREINEGWALWSFILGITYSILTTLYGVYITFLLPSLSHLYVTNASNSALQQAAVAIGTVPSPLDPSGFTKFFLSGLWLLITGVLMIRSRYFALALGYLALIAGIGVLLLFIGIATNTTSLIYGTGVSGAAVVGPIFWLWVGYTLWTKA